MVEKIEAEIFWLEYFGADKYGTITRPNWARKVRETNMSTMSISKSMNGEVAWQHTDTNTMAGDDPGGPRVQEPPTETNRNI